MWNYHQVEQSAQEKVVRYRQEAELVREVGHSSWRARLAQVLRMAAERLEPRVKREEGFLRQPKTWKEA